MTLHYVSEEAVVASTRQESVTDAVAQLYVAMARGEAWHFPVIRSPLAHREAIFGVKAGFQKNAGALGLKAGGLWPHNAARGLMNHQSTTLLFDPETGLPTAMVRAAHLTALRTASASALSIRCLAREDAAILSIIGAGGQAIHQVRAALQERAFKELLVHDFDPARAEALVAQVRDRIPARVADAESAVRRADVLITVTPAAQPIVQAAWVKPGAHLACMGADTKGKQEVEASLLTRARVFVDDIEQAATIGECQHAIASGLVSKNALTVIGDVLLEPSKGRRNDEDITLFDSTGVGLQDVVAAQVALAAAIAQGKAMALA